jgi:hypothetical protein
MQGPSGNDEICANASRLLAWIERETDEAVEYIESDLGFTSLPKGRSHLVDFCMILETNAAISELSAAFPISLS